ncbi:hypothetical protein I3842_01G147600 [Carya illinoinensis]|uniref:Uncharacterized protein n=1 Tax=Carya illinoinensis TaxID=32201 RepID=A0A922G5S3_CARIL|nr:hypothetical protein I3842_01G147600 [Carya illinoinensis]
MHSTRGTSDDSQGSHDFSGQTVKFARRTSSRRYVSLSREDLDIMSGEFSGDYMNYTVHMPPMSNNQPMDTFVAVKVEEQYVSNSLFTGGFNSVTRAHLMDKVIESKVSHPQMAGAKGFACSMPVCDGKVMKDERGADVIPCDCRFKICRDYYMDAQKGSGLCPGCKEPYKAEDYNDDPQDFSKGALPLPTPGGSKKDLKNMSMMKRNQTREFDHNKWLFETKGMYGIGNAYWPQDDIYGEDNDDGLLVLVRLVVLGFFLQWRLTHPNKDAVWLWLMLVVCEVWFAFSWFPKLCPINRSTDLQVLHDKFDMSSPANPTGRSDLLGVDIFISTADLEKEPPLVTACTILSILSVDYPMEKIACYVFDDGGALLTFEAMAEAASFADLWPRNTETYFSLKVDPTKNKSRSNFVKDRKKVKREFDEFKVRINGLPDSIRRRSEAFNAREEMKMMKHMRESRADPLEPIIKRAVTTWMADGTHWPGTWSICASDHANADHAGILHDPLMGGANERIINFSDVDIRLPMFCISGAMNALVRASAILSNGSFIFNLDCDHYIYNCKAIREGMCFMMDRGGENICYIQFPQRFEGIDPSDRYANHNIVFFDGNIRALDGVQGPVYVGTGRLHVRFALYGFDPPQPDKISQSTNSEMQTLKVDKLDPDLDLRNHGRPLADHSTIKYGRPPSILWTPRDPLDSTTVAEAVSAISCWYTEWGDRVGWIYGSVTEDVVTGYRMHNRGWNSVYCITKRLMFLQRLAYLNVGIYPFTSLFLIVYCFLPALSLISGNFIVQTLSVAFLIYLLVITVCLIMLAILEVKWAGIGLEEWWRNEQFWLIFGTNAHLAAVVQGLLKAYFSCSMIAGIEISFTLTSKSAREDADDFLADLYVVKWTSLMIPAIVIAMVNIIAMAIAFSRTIYSTVPQWSKFVGGAFFSF